MPKRNPYNSVKWVATIALIIGNANISFYPDIPLYYLFFGASQLTLAIVFTNTGDKPMAWLNLILFLTLLAGGYMRYVGWIAG